MKWHYLTQSGKTSLELVARRFRVLSEPMRIRLLDQLRDGEATVGELSDALAASQQNVSKHLNVLADSGMLGRRKEGNHVYYRIVDESVFEPASRSAAQPGSSSALCTSWSKA